MELDNQTIEILQLIALIILIASTVLLIVYCVKKHKSKPIVKKNTLELNEEEFRENL